MKRFDLAWLVAKRELVDQMRDWRILLPMIILTLFFPYLMNVAARFTVDYVNQFGAALIAERLLPFLILIVGFFPVTVSLVVALEAFVGEKERGTIEPLLSSPLKDWHLYIGKLLAGTIVPMTVSYIGIAIYMAGLWWQQIKLPALNFVLQTLVLTLAQTVLMVSAAIVISTQSTSVRAANLLASFIVIPVALLIQGESAMMFWGTSEILWVAVLGVSIMSALLIRLGLVHFKRENLLGREIDMLNLGWAWGVFWRQFTGPAADVSRDAQSRLGAFLINLAHWYRREVLGALRQMMPAIVLTFLIGLGAAAATYLYVDWSLPSTRLPAEVLRDAITAIRAFLIDDSPGGVSSATIFWHNLRAELLIMAVGLFSFGVLGLLLYIGNFGFIGGVLAATKLLGLSPAIVFLAGILPHGLFELPSVILSSAGMLYIGVRLVTPFEDKSIGETLLITLADFLKVFLGLCVPLLLVASLVEINLTPRILLAFLGQTLQIQP
jgi:uncharacterized membrane protein SpoIIM required for sporulation/ABC-type transport system involved in multi-copper enzyme maturation permease subunit